MKIHFEGICLKSWSVADAGPLAAIANNRKIADNLRDGFPNPYTIHDARDWLGMILPENHPPRFFAILNEDEIVGSIGIVAKNDIYRKNCEIGYFLSEDHWGRGIATRAIRAATIYAFQTFDIVRLYAEPFADNAGSRRALEKAGYILEARLRKNVIKNGIVKDSCIYGILREEMQDELRKFEQAGLNFT
jgi:RimJ/RimL family protein N-acetyltransferase